MTLRATLAAPLQLGYVALAGAGQPAQVALREGRAELALLLPPGYRARASGAAQNLPACPWLAVLDTDVTTTAQEGLYIVYLFTADVTDVYLSMNQGVTAHRDAFRKQQHPRPTVAALDELHRESALLRGRLGAAVSDLDAEIALQADGYLPRGYEAGNIAAIRYDTANLPTDETLWTDLRRFLGIYKAAVSIRNELVLATPGDFHTSTKRSNKDSDSPVPNAPGLAQFRPKDAADYIANVPAQKQHRTRKHEDLVRRFGEHVRRLGMTAATNVHPRDLVVSSGQTETLVEAKTVGNNAEYAVREAIGQLFAYRHFCYSVQGKQAPRLLALFSDPVGPAFVDLLELLGIEAAWTERGAWSGTPGVRDLLSPAPVPSDVFPP